MVNVKFTLKLFFPEYSLGSELTERGVLEPAERVTLGDRIPTKTNMLKLFQNLIFYFCDA